jgi:acetoin utilization deacetylase AcuC-like enzyme
VTPVQVIYSTAQALHRPPHELDPGGAVAHPDSPERAERILAALRQAGAVGAADLIGPRPPTRDELTRVHDADYLDYLAGIYPAWAAAGQPPVAVLPHCFPTGRGPRRRPAGPVGLAGYHCFDVATPIVAGTHAAAMGAAGCALAGADLLAAGERRVYALCRPPGHHAGRDYCGGFCYLNNAALAAERLSGPAARKVAVLDIDYHHGNGTQEIFYESGRVFYASVHADPDFAYPFFTGRPDETGAGEGLGCTANFPVPPDGDERTWMDALDRAVEAIGRFGPADLIVSFGADTARDDEVGGLGLDPDSFERAARRIARLDRPTLVVQEGGYHLATLGRCVANFLSAL